MTLAAVVLLGYLFCLFCVILYARPKAPEPIFRVISPQYVWRSCPPPPPVPPPHAQPPDEEAEYDEDGALKPEFHGSGRGTNPSFDDAQEGYTIDMRHPENILPKSEKWELFTKIERVEETEDERQERKQKYDAAQ